MHFKRISFNWQDAKLWHKSRTFWIVFAIIIILLLVGGYVWPKKSSATVRTPAILVEVVKVAQQTIPVNINALGSLHADHSVDVSPEVDGQIAKINFSNGQNVKKGRLLFQLDDSIARSQLVAAEAKLKLSKENLHRNHRLIRHDALSQQALDQTIEAVAEDQATVNEKRLLVQKMQLRASFDGTVGSRNVSIGQYVTVGQSLLSLVNTDNLKVIYHVAQTYLSQLKLGQTVEIHSSALPGETFSGTVSYVSPSIDVTTRTVEVHATVPNNAQQLAPGMFVQVAQELSERSNALVIPAQALVATIAGSEVFIVKDGQVSQTIVKVGARWRNKVEITDGLAVGEQIVNVGQQKLRDGSHVQIIGADDSSEGAA